ncbi:MAG TPA: sigma-70 family RNA polymerase sigma factor, partial [Gammaproteobacteria bacterium]|nr:sigma-70 family RNA polymerase sigma factor [Gammaproteobacteria bacterium]
LVQEVFMRMLRFGKSFRDDAAFGPWMFRIARNASADHLRRTAREPQSEPDFDATPADLPTTETLASKDERAKLVEQALAKLPLQGREVLLLSRFEFKTYEEIARVLGCSTGAVKVRAHRAMKQFRSAYLSLSEEAST